MTPFDIKNIIEEKKGRPEWDDELERAYVPYIINLAMSFNQQTILFAAEMNKYPWLPKNQQFDFYYYGIPKGRRYDKWIKQEQLHKDIDMLKNYYMINNREAASLAKLLSKSQLSEIRKITTKGGSK